jgi:hypothetical protein
LSFPLENSDSNSPWAECDEETGEVEGGSAILRGTDLGECMTVLDDVNASDEADAGDDSFADIFLEFD